jgi:hypothetical protein
LQIFDLRYYSIESEYKAHSHVSQAIQAGADVVIGGVITVQASRMLML